MNSKIRRRIVTFLSVFSALMIMGVAFAAWTVNADGDGQARATEAIDLVVGTGTASADLYPGATGDVVVSVDNPNAFPVKISAAAANGAISNDREVDGCPNTSITFNGWAGDIQVAAGATGVTVTLDGAVTMATDAANECQNAVYTVPVSLTAESDAS